MPARSWFIWPILAAALLATLFASQVVAGQQGRRSSKKGALDFLKKKQAKLNLNPYVNGPGKAKRKNYNKKTKQIQGQKGKLGQDKIETQKAKESWEKIQRYEGGPIQKSLHLQWDFSWRHLSDQPAQLLEV